MLRLVDLVAMLLLVRLRSSRTGRTCTMARNPNQHTCTTVHTAGAKRAMPTQRLEVIVGHCHPVEMSAALTDVCSGLSHISKCRLVAHREIALQRKTRLLSRHG
jgi:hypothetical protein